jgi:hypothetical protein
MTALVDGSSAVTRRTLWGLIASTGTGSALMIVHAVYGAKHYADQALYHVIFPALFWLVLSVVLAGIYAWRPGRAKRRALVLSVALSYVGIFGLVHGGVGHLLKLAFYFGGMKSERLAQIFDLGDFVLPDDVTFETTGVATFVAGVLVAYVLVRLLKATRTPRPADATTARNVGEEAAAAPER